MMFKGYDGPEQAARMESTGPKTNQANNNLSNRQWLMADSGKERDDWRDKVLLKVGDASISLGLLFYPYERPLKPCGVCKKCGRSEPEANIDYDVADRVFQNMLLGHEPPSHLSQRETVILAREVFRRLAEDRCRNLG